MIAGHKSYLPAVVEPDRALSDVCDDLLTGDKDRGGRAILRYSPDAKLRSRLEVRRLELQAALTPALPADLARTVTEMMVGFSSARVNEVDAEIVVAQYVSVLADLPLWAVQMACRRFARGPLLRPSSTGSPRHPWSGIGTKNSASSRYLMASPHTGQATKSASESLESLNNCSRS